MIVGFTGTRWGMTAAQHRAVCQLVQELRPTEVHHGCCVGADAQLHEAAKWFWPVHGHPGPDGPNRARLEGFARLYPAVDFCDRNQDIVDACDVLVAAPAEQAPQSSGGTWQTVRRAYTARKRVIIVWSDGSRAE